MDKSPEDLSTLYFLPRTSSDEERYLIKYSIWVAVTKWDQLKLKERHSFAVTVRAAALSRFTQ